MQLLSSTDVRKNWSVTLDSVIHERPAYIKRTRDSVVLLNMDTLTQLLSGYRFTAQKFVEDDGSVTLSLDHIDIVVNGKDDMEARIELASDIKEYAEDYYEHYASWSLAHNRRAHIPYVLKALTLDKSAIMEELECRNGKN